MKTNELKKLVEDRDRILADIADFDGDRRGHYAALQSVDDQLEEVLPALARELIALREAAGELAQYVPDQIVECRGDKCRQPWCASCYQIQDAEKAVMDAQAKLATLRAVLGESE
jgi:hypothetical protein